MSPKKACHVGAVPECEPADLDEALQKYVDIEAPEKRFQLGAYLKVTKEKGAKATSLLGLKLLLIGLLSIGTLGRFKPKFLEERLLHLAEANRKKKPPLVLNESEHRSDSDWAKFMAGRLGVALHHVRQCHHSEKKYSAAMSQLDDDEQMILAEIVKSCDATSMDVSHPAAPSTTPPHKKQRTLEPKVSCDSDGYPKILTGDDSDSDRSVASSVLYDENGLPVDEDGYPTMLGEGISSDDPDLLREADEAAAMPLTTERGARKKEVKELQKKPAAAAKSAPASHKPRRTAERTLESAVFGRMRITPATGSSYVCHFVPTTGKWAHIVTVRHSLPTEKHQQICWKLFRMAAERPEQHIANFQGTQP